MSTEVEGDTRKTLLPAAVGWGALVTLAAYAVFLHQGLGSAPGGWASLWWHPTSFLLLDPTIRLCWGCIRWSIPPADWAMLR